MGLFKREGRTVTREVDFGRNFKGERIIAERPILLPLETEKLNQKIQERKQFFSDVERKASGIKKKLTPSKKFRKVVLRKKGFKSAGAELRKLRRDPKELSMSQGIGMSSLTADNILLRRSETSSAEESMLNPFRRRRF